MLPVVFLLSHSLNSYIFTRNLLETYVASQVKPTDNVLVHVCQTERFEDSFLKIRCWKEGGRTNFPLHGRKSNLRRIADSQAFFQSLHILAGCIYQGTSPLRIVCPSRMRALAKASASSMAKLPAAIRASSCVRSEAKRLLTRTRVLLPSTAERTFCTTR